MLDESDLSLELLKLDFVKLDQMNPVEIGGFAVDCAAYRNAPRACLHGIGINIRLFSQPNERPVVTETIGEEVCRPLHVGNFGRGARAELAGPTLLRQVTIPAEIQPRNYLHCLTLKITACLVLLSVDSVYCASREVGFVRPFCLL